MMRLISSHRAISIHPLRGEWDFTGIPNKVGIYISIHPLRGEWDSKTAQKNMQFLYKANNVTDSVCVLCAYDHETSKNFVHLFTLFCANLPGILCSLMVRIRQPKSLPLHTTFSLRNAQPLFDSDSRDNKIAGYLCLYS